MQEPLFSPTLLRKLYSERSILIGTFLGGPLVAAYLLAENFNALGQEHMVGRTWLFAGAALLLLFGTAYIPVLEHLPNLVYSFVYCWTAHFLARKFQGSSIQLHTISGGKLYSTWRAVVAGIICMVIMVAVVVLLLYLVDPSVLGI